MVRCAQMLQYYLYTKQKGVIPKGMVFKITIKMMLRCLWILINDVTQEGSYVTA